MSDTATTIFLRREEHIIAKLALLMYVSYLWLTRRYVEEERNFSQISDLFLKGA